MKIEIKRIPFIPKQVDLNDLHPNGKLFSDKSIANLRTIPLDNGRIRYTNRRNENTRLKYAIIKMDDDYYAIYSGKKRLGTGAHAKVKLAQNLETGEWFALKIQSYDQLLANNNTKSTRELNNLMTMNSIALAKPNNKPVNFQHYSLHHDADKQDYLVMQYARGETLEYFAQTTRTYPAVIYLNMIIAFLKAVQRVHRAGLLHRDIKLNNVIYDPIADRCELVDYGLSIKKNNTNRRSDYGFFGTVGYVAPELIQQLKTNNNTVICTDKKNKIVYSSKSDNYAAGVTLRLLLNLTSIRTRTPYWQAHSLLLHGNTEKRITRIQDVNLYNKINEFTERMVSEQPNKRPTLTEAIFYFNQLRQSLSIEDRTIHVALLDVNDLNQSIKKQPSDALEQLKIQLKKQVNLYQVLWLVDSKDILSEQELAKVAHDFSEQGFWVAPVVYVGKPNYHIMGKYNAHGVPIKNDDTGRCVFAIDELTLDDRNELEDYLSENKIQNKL